MSKKVIKTADVRALANLEDARTWWKQQDQFLWAEDKLAQHDIGATWVGTLEWSYDRLIDEHGEGEVMESPAQLWGRSSSRHSYD